MCNVHNVPLATNLATADLIIAALGLDLTERVQAVTPSRPQALETLPLEVEAGMRACRRKQQAGPFCLENKQAVPVTSPGSAGGSVDVN